MNSPAPAPVQPATRAFTLLELMVVIGIIAIMLVAAIPAVRSLTQSSGTKSAVSNLMNAVEHARSLAITSGAATYVVFADENAPESHRCKAFIIFKDNDSFQPVAVTKWTVLPEGIAFRPSIGLLSASAGATAPMFISPAPVGPSPRALPYLKFEPSGMVVAPDDPTRLFADIFSGFVTAAGEMTYTNANQRTTQKFDSVAVARFTGRARYVDPHSG